MGEKVITIERLRSLVDRYSVVNSSGYDPDVLLNTLLDSIKCVVD